MVVATRAVTKGEKEKALTAMVNDMPDEVFQLACSYLAVEDMVSFQSCCHRFHQLNLEATWKERCEQRWQSWPRYHRLLSSKEKLEGIAPDWKGRYRWVEEDVSRTEVTEEDLQSLNWYFNFVPRAGGRGRSSMVRCEFRDGLMRLSGYPPLRYHLVLQGLSNDDDDEFLVNFPLWNALLGHGLSLVDDEQVQGDYFEPKPGSRRVKLQVEEYPSHRVRRMKRDGEWLITNPYVTIVSCDKAASPSFTGRGFQF